MDYQDEEQTYFSLVDFFKYMNGNTDSITKGETILHGNYVMLCGILNAKTVESDGFYKLYALCLKASDTDSPPHVIQGQLRVHNFKCVVGTMVCSCENGASGRCKHISAVLLRCTRTAINKLEALSQREIDGPRFQEALGSKGPFAVEDMCCVKKMKKGKRKSKQLSSIQQEEIRQMFAKALPNSLLALHMKGSSSNLSNNDDEL